MLRLLGLVSVIAIVGCKTHKQSFQTEKVDGATIHLIDQAIDSGIDSTVDSADITITINSKAESISNIDSQAFLELQDYIIQRFEAERPRLSNKLKLGISFNFSEKIASLEGFLSNIKEKSYKLENLAENMDFVQAYGIDLNSKSINSLLAKIGIRNSKSKASTSNVLKSTKVNRSSCQKRIDIIKSQGLKTMAIEFSEGLVSPRERQEMSRCISSASRAGLKINLLVNTILGKKG